MCFVAQILYHYELDNENYITPGGIYAKLLAWFFLYDFPKNLCHQHQGQKLATLSTQTIGGFFLNLSAGVLVRLLNDFCSVDYIGRFRLKFWQSFVRVSGEIANSQWSMAHKSKLAQPIRGGHLIKIMKKILKRPFWITGKIFGECPRKYSNLFEKFVTWFLMK